MNLQSATQSYLVRLMDQSPLGGIIIHRPESQFAIVNCNRVVDGARAGCASVLFAGSIPSLSELKTCDIEVQGTWQHHQKFGLQFCVSEFGVLPRGKAAKAEFVMPKTKRLNSTPVKKRRANGSESRSCTSGTTSELARAKPKKTRAAPRRPRQKALDLPDHKLKHWSDGGGDSLDFLDR